MTSEPGLKDMWELVMQREERGVCIRARGRSRQRKLCTKVVGQSEHK